MSDPPIEFSITSSTDRRWSVLAGLRFFLAMVVVDWHLDWFAPPGHAPLAALGGTAAVLGFLVISGYSIAHSLQRRPKGFYRRRVLRIYPLYVCAVLFSLLPFWTGADALATRSSDIIVVRPAAWVVIANLLMLQNLICRAVESNPLVWTLGIEVICYLFAPLLRKAPSWILLVLIGISSIAFALYPRMNLPHYALLLWGLPLLLFVWAWLAGFVLHRSGTSLLVGIGVALLGGVLLVINDKFPARFSVEDYVGATLMVTMAGSVPVPGAVAWVLNYLGDLSYPVYLFHLPAFLMGYCVMNVRSPAVLVLFALAISVVFLFIESIVKPILSAILNRSRASDSAAMRH